MMDVDIISREIIKPSSPAIHHIKPFKLSLLDQITPTTYASLILFYPKNHVPVWIQRFPLNLGLRFLIFFVPAALFDQVNREQCTRALFTDPQIPLFSNFFIKNRSHNTIHTFKNYFATVFSVSVFSFSKNKFNPNGPHIHSKNPQAHLKNSLSKTLNSFYPFSGRMKDNLFIDYYDKGIPYNEARVYCCLSDFLQHPKTESLNHFLPCCPFLKEPKPMEVAPLAVQVNVFDCGGIAIGFTASHKFIDGTTMSAFLKNWAATAGGPSNKLVNPNFAEASSLSHFPPQNILPHIAKPLVERLWFSEGKYKTRRFVFDAKAIATLRAKARSERVENPTRIESLSSFIYKHARAASRLASGSPRPSILAQAISIRGKAKPRLSDSSMGNIFWWALAAYDYNSAELTEIEMRGLVATLKEAVSKIDSDVRILQGHEGFIGMIEYAIQKAATVVFSRENPEIFAFTSWLTFGFNKVDFGWGKPIWVGLMGEVGFGRKLTILQNAIYGKGIEAWVTLDENVMAILEDDAEFLALATLNPSAISQ